MTKQRMIWISPVLVVLISTISIRVAASFIGVWAWLPWILIYWATIGALVVWGGGKESIQRWMRPAEGNWLWSGLAVLLGLSAITMFISSWQLLKPLYIFVPWLILGIVNPFLEEWYWRGLILDTTQTWPDWIRVFVFQYFLFTQSPFWYRRDIHWVTASHLSDQYICIGCFILRYLFEDKEPAMVNRKSCVGRFIGSQYCSVS